MPRYRDTIHGKVEFGAETWDFVTSWRPLVRLREIAQLGLAKVVYPNAVHSRYDHSLGTACAVKKVLGEAQRSSRGVGPLVRDGLLELMACMHDIGHGPCSHVAEQILKRHPRWRPGGVKKHEQFTELLLGSPERWGTLASDLAGVEFHGSTDLVAILDRCRSAGGTLATIAGHVGELLDFQLSNTGLGLPGPLHEAFGEDADGLPRSPEYGFVSNQFDVDRMDYLLRDGHAANLISLPIVESIWEGITRNTSSQLLVYQTAHNGHRILPGLVLQDAAIDALELFLWTRQNHFRNIAFHPRVRLAEMLWRQEAEKRLANLERDAGGLAVKNEVLKWFTLFTDSDMRRELGDSGVYRRMEALGNISRESLLDGRGTNGEWEAVACPFWVLDPHMRTTVMDAMEDDGDEATEPAHVQLERSVLRSLGMDEANANSLAFIDFAIPPVNVPNSLVRIGQADTIPLTLARSRSAALVDLALAPFRDGQVVLYVHRNARARVDRGDIRHAVAAALEGTTIRSPRLRTLSTALAPLLRGRDGMTIHELSNAAELREGYGDYPKLVGSKESGTSVKTGICLRLERDLDALWVCGVLSKSIATFHSDSTDVVWANLLVKYSVDNNPGTVALHEAARALYHVCHDLSGALSQLKHTAGHVARASALPKSTRPLLTLLDVEVEQTLRKCDEASAVAMMVVKGVLPDVHDFPVVPIDDLVRDVARMLVRHAKARDVQIDIQLPSGPVRAKVQTGLMRFLLSGIICEGVAKAGAGGTVWVGVVGSGRECRVSVEVRGRRPRHDRGDRRRNLTPTTWSAYGLLKMASFVVHAMGGWVETSPPGVPEGGIKEVASTVSPEWESLVIHLPPAVTR
jgi:HD superfamily phosphohydrolase